MKKLHSIVFVAALLSIMAFSPLPSKKIIVIDAAHGGLDNGVMAGDITEKQLVLEIAEKIKTLNKNENIEIILLRSGDANLKMDERITKVNALTPDLLISIHANHSDDETQNGASAIVSIENLSYGISSAQAQKAVEAITGTYLNKRPVEQKNIALLKKCNCPAFLLEVGYLSNKGDQEYITSDFGKEEIAKQILDYLQ